MSWCGVNNFFHGRCAAIIAKKSMICDNNAWHSLSHPINFKVSMKFLVSANYYWQLNITLVINLI